MSQPLRAVHNVEYAATKPAGGSSHINDLHDRRASLLYSGGSAMGRRHTAEQPAHLQSAMAGAGLNCSGVHRPSSAQVPASPRYMQSTAASARKASPRASSGAKFEAPQNVAPPIPRDTRFDDYPPTLPAELFVPPSPAGGDSNATFKNQIDYVAEEDGPRRTFRRSIESPHGPVHAKLQKVPATVESIASPTRGATALDDKPAYAPSAYTASDQRRPSFDTLPGFFMAPAASGGPWINGDSTSRERLASPYFNTHDKSLPNARRSQRGSGVFLPPPVQAATTHEPHVANPALPPPQPAFLTDAGFSSAAMHRRGRGEASPAPAVPADPNAAAGTHRSVRGHGMASGSLLHEKRDPHLGGRRARGFCSPRIGGGDGGAAAALAWGGD